jgi:hypothetical protein
MNKTVESKRSFVDRAFDKLGVSRNSKQPRAKVAVAALALTAAGISVLAAGLISLSVSRANGDNEFTTFTVDVTQDGNTNKQIDVDPSEGQLVSSKGDAFIVEGNIYPEGSIPSGVADPNPTAQVIGRYRLRGTLTADTAEFNRAVAGDPSAPPILAFATEAFSLPDDGTTILADGVWPNARLSANRVVLGGTGRFAGVAGEVYEKNIGENSTGFCNSRVTFRLKRLAAGH